MSLKVCSRCRLLQKLGAKQRSKTKQFNTKHIGPRSYSAKAGIVELESSWQPVIGLEIHAQIKSNSKLFSSAKNQFMAPPNSLVSEFDAALPGTLPVLNRKCVESAILSSLALQCKINQKSYFDRKHYFYADLPQGYQITQQRKPVAVDGHVVVPASEGCVGSGMTPDWKKIRIIQIQLEQDSGKSLHDEIGRTTLIDLNRAGVGLMEIVTAPDFSSAEEAVTFVLDLQLTLRQLGTCGGKIAEGQLRVDANISLHRPGEPLGVRSEVKNVAGLRNLQQAIEYEISRQKCLLTSGEEVVNETREFDSEKGITISMRDKEVSQDYRFMPEPNLPPLIVYDDNTLPSKRDKRQFINIDDIRRKLPDRLPSDIRVLLMGKHLLSRHDSSFLLENGLAEYFIKVLESNQHLPVMTVLKFVQINLAGLLNKRNITAAECPVSPAQVGAILEMFEEHEIKSEHALKTFFWIAEKGGDPVEIVDSQGWRMVKDIAVITDLVQKVLETKDVEKLLKNYRPGRHKRSRNKSVVAGIVSTVMEISHNKVHTAVTQTVVREILDRYSNS